MSLNHLLNRKFEIPLHTKTFQTDKLTLKMSDGVYHEFVPNIMSIYTKNESSPLNFLNELRIDDTFTLHRPGNFNSRKGASKIMLNINLIYKFVGEYSPDFTVNVKVSDVTVYNNKEGLSDYPNTVNKLTDSIILDINENDNITLYLSKVNADDVTNFTLYKNSYYSIEML
jgi:hypothetical protein